MIRRPPRSTQSRSSAASDVYKRQYVLVFYPWHCNRRFNSVAPKTLQVRPMLHHHEWMVLCRDSLLVKIRLNKLTADLNHIVGLPPPQPQQYSQLKFRRR
eukprot:TRINITY_DN284_c0_g1_i2.p2 TRINITY_DN284_c0_g1~~TRINITY_DN284_c0_g1_i2.p2  ORF type:complete len:100 (-),score=15.02 TRINITY_DN284_c0_g1_i2:309-608(-)